ncbi:hypothetical protein JCM8097_009370 [Rhodosporidiobolus ruineniae]
MAKSSNPVDAHRKAQRKAEIKRNKATRTKQKEVTTIKKDTRPIEAEIRRLTQQAQKGPLSKADKDELASLRAELASITKAKNEYVEKHPEHRKFVFPAGQGGGEAEDDAADGAEPPGLYDRSGKLKHPERSLYYDPVYNPFGVPPPGMPYREKPEYEMARLGIPTPEQLAAFQPQVEAESEEDSDEDDEDEDDDIVMPAGPPPTGKAEDAPSDDSDSDDDDIALPPGPPPPKPSVQPASTTSRVAISRPSSRPHPPTFPQQPYNPQPLPARPNFSAPPPAPSLLPPPGAPSGPRNPHLPARPAPPTGHMSDPLNKDSGPNRAFQQGRAPPAGPQIPPGAVITAAPTPAAPSPFLPIPGASSAAAAASSATISAAPVLRDLKKEATAFVPSAMRKKMAQQKAQLAKVGLSAVNAAPAGATAEGGEEGGEPVEKKKTLMEEMRERGIGAAKAGAAGAGQQAKPTGDDDYARFQDEMKDFL